MNDATPRPVPDEFAEAHYAQEHVMSAMGIDEPTFWGMYVEGLIPRGVSLMRFAGVPLICWPRQMLDEWVAAGCPADPAAVELQRKVIGSLVDAYRAEGVVFTHNVDEGESSAD